MKDELCPPLIDLYPDTRIPAALVPIAECCGSVLLSPGYYNTIKGTIDRLTRERDLYREGYEAFMLRPGHDRQRTCHADDGWGRIRAAVKAIDDYTDQSGSLGRAKEKHQ